MSVHSVADSVVPGPHIHCVVPTRNKLAFLERCLASIRTAIPSDGSVRVTVVDHASTDATPMLLERESTWLTAIRYEGPTVAAARNAGAATGDAPVLVFLDCDVSIPADFFARVVAVTGDARVSITGYDVALPETGTHWCALAWYKLHLVPGDGPTRFMNGACLIIDRRTFEQVGGFPESMETGEDTGICRRVLAAGGVIRRDHRLQVLHLDNPPDVVQFFRKHRWHGIGVAHVPLLSRGNLPGLAATIWFGSMVVAIACAVALARTGRPGIASGIVVASVVGVPALVVLARLRQGGAVPRPLHALAAVMISLAARATSVLEARLGFARS